MGKRAASTSSVMLLAMVLVLLLSPGAAAADRIYVISSEEADLYIMDDGSADIKYTFDITVRPHSTVIDSFVIHLPNWRFEEDQLTATMDGERVLGVNKGGSSESNLEVSLNSKETMQPGTSHTFVLVVNVGAMVLKHPSDDDKARVTFTPTWWNDKEVQSIQRLEVNIHLPEGLTDVSKVDATDGYNVTDHGGRTILTWQEEEVPADRKADFRVDIPASSVDKVYDPFWDLQMHFLLGYILVAVIIVVIVIAAFGVKRALRRPYIKPFLRVEAWGARKGLNAAEAALLLGLKRGRVAKMHLIDLVMAGAIDIKDAKEMRVEVLNPGYEGRSGPFLGVIRGGRVDPIAVTNLIEGTRDDLKAKMMGFDTDDTKALYEAKAKGVWDMVKRGRPPTPDDILWLLVDPKADKRARDGRPKGVPDWTKWVVPL